MEERVSALETTLASLQTLPGEFAAFRLEVHERFEQADRRFEHIDAWFEQVDRRFKQIDARFEQIDVRFAEVDDRFTRLEARITHESEYLYARMRMLHEEVIERIERLGESSQGSGSVSPRRRRRRKR